MKMVCIKTGPWLGVLSGKPVPYRAPNFGEVVTVTGHDPVQGRPFLYLEGYDERHPSGARVKYAKDQFRPLVKDEPKAATKDFVNLLKGKQDA